MMSTLEHPKAETDVILNLQCLKAPMKPLNFPNAFCVVRRRHASQIDQTREHQDNMETRAEIHRWNLSTFCNTDGSPFTRTTTTTTTTTTTPVPDANAGGIDPIEPDEQEEETTPIPPRPDHDDLANDRVGFAGEHTTYE